MLTRLKVSGFKNLVEVDVHFGPFTCIAGENGVGKSNLFDAIRFLAALADLPLVEAALSVRAEEGGRTSDLRSLFHRVGNAYTPKMSFEADMIIPTQGTDDLGQKAEATITFVRYSLTLRYREGETSPRSLGSLEILEEKLDRINIGDAPRLLLFPHKPVWRRSVIKGRRIPPFISTEPEADNDERVIKLHQDGGPGRTLSLRAASLPRTVLSTTNAAENRTASLVRREMRSWLRLQLEPSSLRRSDEFTAPHKLGADGSHLAATLYHLGRHDPRTQTDGTTGKGNHDEPAIYAEVANRLSELIDDVRAVTVDRDEQRELLTLQVSDRDDTRHPARSLSDGTLRFLALAVLALDPEAQGVICLEEPENGIHPERLPAMLRLLQAIATDTNEPVGSDNPLRQVIINTHSPAVVAQVPEDCLLMAELKEAILQPNTVESVPKCYNRATFSCLDGTWRARLVGDKTAVVSRGRLLAYLNPVLNAQQEEAVEERREPPRLQKRRARRVVDRPDLQLWLISQPPE